MDDLIIDKSHQENKHYDPYLRRELQVLLRSVIQKRIFYLEKSFGDIVSQSFMTYSTSKDTSSFKKDFKNVEQNKTKTKRNKKAKQSKKKTKQNKTKTQTKNKNINKKTKTKQNKAKQRETNLRQKKRKELN